MAPKWNRPICTRWFKYDRDYLCVNKSHFVPVIFEPPCSSNTSTEPISRNVHSNMNDLKLLRNLHIRLQNS
jgi:hypothetical protein